MRKAWIACAALVLLSFGLPQTPAQAPAPVQPTLHIVKYAGLGEAIRQHEGKVVLVDFWTVGCASCIEEVMPHMIKLQQMYGKDGLVVLTVNLDGLKDEFDPKFDGKVEALKCLQRKEAGVLQNYLLDESVDLWQAKLRFNGVPAAYVFNRQGKHRSFRDARYTPEGVDQAVLEFLKAK